ncbi:hypothetical protein D3C75_1084860 [compost metagenome]
MNLSLLQRTHHALFRPVGNDFAVVDDNQAVHQRQQRRTMGNHQQRLVGNHRCQRLFDQIFAGVIHRAGRFVHQQHRRVEQ